MAGGASLGREICLGPGEGDPRLSITGGPILIERSERCSKLVDWAEEYTSGTPLLPVPRASRKRFKSPKIIEGFNEKIMRRTVVVRIFPNETSALRVSRALELAMHECFDRGVGFLPRLNCTDLMSWRGNDRGPYSGWNLGNEPAPSRNRPEWPSDKGHGFCNRLLPWWRIVVAVAFEAVS